MRMKVSNYIAKLLVQNGITDVFMITGGGAMHLDDGLGHEPGLTVYIIIMSRHVPLQQKAMPESITALQLSVSQQDLAEQTQSQV